MAMRCASLLSLAATVSGLSEQYVRTNGHLMWRDFKKAYKKSYSMEEEDQRHKVFIQNMYEAARSEKENPGATFGPNKFADLTELEFKQYHNLKVPEKESPPPIFSAAEVKKALAESVDWRSKGAVTQVKDQAQCGSCWAFSSTGGIEGANVVLAGNKLTSVSEQELVSCDKVDDGCNGGLMDNAYEWLVSKRSGQIVTEESYPYTSGSGKNGKCKGLDGKAVGSTISGHKDITQNEEQMATYMLTNGPLPIAVDAASHWQTYKSGVVSNCKGKQLDHGVLAVGYTSEYWIVKNSWGSSWGESGYIRLAFGSNQCGLKKSPTAALTSGSAHKPDPVVKSAVRDRRARPKQAADEGAWPPTHGEEVIDRTAWWPSSEPDTISTLATSIGLGEPMFSYGVIQGAQDLTYNAEKKTMVVGPDWDNGPKTVEQWKGVTFKVNTPFLPNQQHQASCFGKEIDCPPDVPVMFEWFNGGIWTGVEDQSSAIAMTWDDDNLYLAVVVRDDTHDLVGTSYWNGDSVQLMFANDAQTTQTHLYNWALTNAGAMVYGDEFPSNPNGDDTVANIVRVEETNVTFYQVKFPVQKIWAFDKWKAGDQLGVGVCVNDGDVGDTAQKGWGGWGPHSIVIGKNADRTGLVTLVAASTETPTASPSASPAHEHGDGEDGDGNTTVSTVTAAAAKSGVSVATLFLAVAATVVGKFAA